MNNIKYLLIMLALVLGSLALELIHSTINPSGMIVPIIIIINILLDLGFGAALFITAIAALSSKPSSISSAIVVVVSVFALFSQTIVFIISIAVQGFPANRIPSINPGSYLGIASAFILVMGLFNLMNLRPGFDKGNHVITRPEE